ncbi:MAG: Transcription activator effector binding (Modular protein) [Firmicutes bacterium]|nr:Transcription activator effector binding (Modular protein) [Bacillota bacterium]
MNYLEDTYKIVSYIEDNIDKDIYINDVIQFTQLSKFHFIRIFKALTGITVNEYIRRRKLSKAACELVETKKAIIDIATFYGYGSQAAFTRAFKDMYGLTPKAYRVSKRHFANLDQVVFSEAILYNKRNEDEIKPSFIEMQKMTIVGMQYKGNNENREIPKLWSRFVPRAAEIKNALNGGLGYGYETYTEDSKGNGEFTYIAGIEAECRDIVPQGMVSIEIPANRYAVFPISSIIDDVPQIIKRIYSKLLFDLKLEPCDTYDFELFDESFIPNDCEAKHCLYIPIK